MILNVMTAVKNELNWFLKQRKELPEIKGKNPGTRSTNA